MKKKHAVAFVICFSFLFCFLCVGYAALTDTLTVDGKSDLSPQEGVFISDATAPNNAIVNKYLATTLNISFDFSQTNSATATITVFNNSPYDYVFNGVVYDETIEDNQYIDYKLSGLTKGDSVVANSSLIFKVIYSPKSTATETSLTSIFNYQFVLDSEYIPEIAASGAIARFEEILNNTTDMKTLTDQMDETGSWWSGERSDDSYIGNVVGSGSTDSTVVNNLFTVNGENALVLDIGGTTTKVTAMIKRENVDGNTATGDDSGNEMTIYMTSFDPSTTSTPQVFAAVFTKDADGEWYQLGEMYEGKAESNNYNGIRWEADNSFDTDTWVSAQEYHGQSSGKTINQLIAAYKAS